MKRLPRFLAALAVLAAVACGRAPSRSLRKRHCSAISSAIRPVSIRRRTPRRPGLLVDAMILRPLVAIDADRRPVPSLAASWTRLAGRAELRVPSRPEVHLGVGRARDVRRRALHDRARARSEGRRPRRGGPRSRTSPRSRRPMPRRCASGSRSRTPSGCSRSRSRSFRMRHFGREGRGRNGTASGRQRALSPRVVGDEPEASGSCAATVPPTPTHTGTRSSSA